MQRRFGLRDAVVVAGEAGAAPSAEAVCRAAAEYLAALQPKPAVLGVSWGRTLAAVARHLPQGWAPDLHVVQVNGAVSLRSGMAGANSVAEDFARSAPGAATLIPAPAILGSAASREVLERDRVIAEALRLAAAAPVLVFTMGAVGADSVHLTSGTLTAEEMARLARQGAVGDILGRFVDGAGRIADAGIDARTLGLPLDSLAARPRAIGVVAGPAKRAVARAALKAGYVNTLVTDAETALFALEPDHA